MPCWNSSSAISSSCSISESVTAEGPAVSDTAASDMTLAQPVGRCFKNEETIFTDTRLSGSAQVKLLRLCCQLLLKSCFRCVSLLMRVVCLHHTAHHPTAAFAQFVCLCIRELRELLASCCSFRDTQSRLTAINAHTRYCSSGASFL